MRARLFLLTAFTLAAPASALSLLPGDLVVGGSGGLYRVDPATGDSALVSAGDYSDHAAAPGGAVYAIEGDTLYAIDPSDGSRTEIPLSAGQSVLHGVTFEPATGSLLVLTSDADTALTPIVEAVRVDPAVGGGTVFASGGLLSPALPFWEGPSDVELSIDGDLLFTSRALPSSTCGSLCFSLLSIDAGTGAVAVLRDGSFGVDEWNEGHAGIGVGPDGDVYSVDNYSLGGGVERLDWDTMATLQSAHIGIPSDVVQDPVGRDVAVGLDGTVWLTRAGGLFRLDPVTMEPIVEAGGLGLAPYAGEIQVVPVPEPGTAALLALGVGALASRRPSRRHRA